MASKYDINKKVILKLFVLIAALFVFVVSAYWIRNAFLDYAMESLIEKHETETEERATTTEEEIDNAL